MEIYRYTPNETAENFNKVAESNVVSYQGQTPKLVMQSALGDDFKKVVKSSIRSVSQEEKDVYAKVGGKKEIIGSIVQVK